MRREKQRHWILMLIILVIIIAICVYFVQRSNESEEDEEVTTTETEVIVTDILNTISNSSYVSTALEENKELHATYYFEEIYFGENDYVEAGENILKYTNGEYMVAPYNCVITGLSIPNSGEICTNNHYITIASTDTLQISLSIGEDELEKVYVGQEAIIEVDVLENVSITGYVTNIGNTANHSSSGSSFSVEVEFQNNGDILLGMSAKCYVVLEKAEDVIAVATETITEENNKSYVTIQLSDGTTETVEVETGISNDAYTEIKNGLSEGDIALIEEDSTGSNNGMSWDRGGSMDMGGDMMNSQDRGGNAGDMRRRRLSVVICGGSMPGNDR